jgi:hypothetical protein
MLKLEMGRRRRRKKSLLQTMIAGKMNFSY